MLFFNNIILRTKETMKFIKIIYTSKSPVIDKSKVKIPFAQIYCQVQNLRDTGNQYVRHFGPIYFWRMRIRKEDRRKARFTQICH